MSKNTDWGITINNSDIKLALKRSVSVIKLADFPKASLANGR